jgi:S1-C subfamily serine protease
MAIKKDKLINFGLMFVLGGIGGILGSQLLFPWLAGIAYLRNIDWIRQAGEGTTVINQTEKIIITENQALEEAIAKGSGIVVGIISERTKKTIAKKVITLEKPEILAQGTGFIASADGLVITAQNLIPETTQKTLVVYGGRQFEAEIKKTDKELGVVLLKINENNLPVMPFLGEDIKLGEQLFLIGTKLPDFDKFVDLSIAKQISPALNLEFASQEIVGSPIFNVKGEIVGLNWADSNGQAKTTLSYAIKELLK